MMQNLMDLPQLLPIAQARPIMPKRWPPDAVLSWSPGAYVASHDVYFGTDFNDVNDANTSSSEYKGNQPLNANSYDGGERKTRFGFRPW